MPSRDWTRDEDYADVDQLDAAGLAWEFARRNPGLREALRRPGADLAPWGLAVPADPELSASAGGVWWRWEFASGIVVALVEAPGSGVTVAHLKAAAVQEVSGRMRFPNGLQAVFPPALADTAEVAAILPLSADLPGRYAEHLAGRPLPAETRAYVARLGPRLLGQGGANVVRPAGPTSWTHSPLFPSAQQGPEG